ncbi:hypothetical protein TrCOL_g1857 [Triparma columacea]|uniref:Uncharacterized protein n=1 Tax=Triparma columacea TaxID=722753 RepID=A0A9W7L5I2_9STRA|nr:hypothetical protein TrCOL_g1857 [Triparma columacea]
MDPIFRELPTTMANPLEMLTEFVMNNIGWTFNFFFSQLLWWLYAFPAMNDYGYDDANKDSSTGAIPSGPSGSGVAIVPTMLMVIGLVTWTGKLLTFKPATA